jgi:anaphase-promoting complex subunit 10
MDGDKREIGDEAVWSLSTAKPGNGVHQLRDGCNSTFTSLSRVYHAHDSHFYVSLGNIDTYWQSDGTQPHLINIQFHKKMTISDIALYLDFKLDESYTPRKLSIRAGTTFHDLTEIKTQTISEPSGWITIPLMEQPCHLAVEHNGPMQPVRSATYGYTYKRCA